tara:strand:+ start:88 stop:1182 length:1095 start_codon:yes stop_codon:yes gene_type:complete
MMHRAILWACALLFAQSLLAVPASANVCTQVSAPSLTPEQVEQRIGQISDTGLSGLAAYFDHTNRFAFSDGEWARVSRQTDVRSACRVVVLGRVESLMLVPGEGAFGTGRSVRGYVIPTPELTATYGDLKYRSVWAPLRPLVRFGDFLMQIMVRYLGFSWGLAIIALALVVKVLLYPVARFTERARDRVARETEELRPHLAEIKRLYTGEEAHNRVLEVHEKLGISTTYRIRPIFWALVQIPIFIATFHLLGLMPQLYGQSFLWIGNLGLPDAILAFPVAVPVIGDTLNFFPFLLAISIVASSLIVDNPVGDATGRRKIPVNALFVAALFFVLMHSFPAALLLYWTSANVLNVLDRKIRDMRGV